MTILEEKTLREVQQEFNEKFPFLRLNFYTAPHGEGTGSPDDLKIDPELTVAEARTVHTEGELSISANQKISTLEKRFAEQFGLYVQVFRQSGNLWLQSNKTDHWTLAEANRKGEHSVTAYQEKYQS